MQWLGFLILVGIIAIILIAAIYFGSHQKSRRSPYGSWSSILGPRTYSPTMDTRENLEREISRGRKTQRTRSKKK